MTLDDLTVAFDHLDRNSLLSDWTWLIGKRKVPILLSASGDAFLQDLDEGAVYVLDVGAGSTHCVASSVSNFQSLLADKEFAMNYLAVEMIADLRASRCLLGPGQIYSLKKPLALGGEYEMLNIEPTNIEVHFSVAGQIHEQVSRLPAGTQIKSVKIR